MNMVDDLNNKLTSVGMSPDGIHFLVYIELRVIEDILDELVI